MSNNTSGYKGVSLHKDSGLWRAHIGVNGRKLALGYFYTPEAAAAAYDHSCRELHGEFARTNFDGLDTEHVDQIPEKRQRPPRNWFLGVTRNQQTGRWTACVQGCLIGMYETALDAARARDAVSLRLKGDKSKLNKMTDNNAAQDAA